MSSCVLAYSGGLDTSVILGWLMDQGLECHAVYVDLGQPCEDRRGHLEEGRRCGSKIRPHRRRAGRAMPRFRLSGAGVASKIRRPLSAGNFHCPTADLKSMFAGRPRSRCTRPMPTAPPAKGTINAGFNLAAEALDANIEVIAPWRMKKFRDQFPGRTELIAFCQEKNIPVKASVAKPYSSDENCLHISYEAGKLEELDVSGVETVDFGMGVSPAEAPDNKETVTIDFESGVPVAVNGNRLSALGIVETLNQIGGRNGIGRIDMVENRFVGMKSRGVYEAPGMTILYDAHRYVEQLTMDRDLMHLRDRLSPEVAEMVYYGFWYCPKFDALLAFNREAQKNVTGSVTLDLYKGNISIAKRSSPNSLYDDQIATMEGGGSYNQDDAEGFLRIQGLPGRVQARILPRNY